MTQELQLDPALRERMALEIFKKHVGKSDAALMAQKYTPEQMLQFSRHYAIYVDTVVALMLAAGGTLPGAALVEVDPLA